MEIQLVLITHQFYICKFLYSLKHIWNPKTNTLGAFVVFHRHAQGSENVEFPGVHVLRKSETGLSDFLLPCHTANNCSFYGQFSATFFTFVFFHW